VRDKEADDRIKKQEMVARQAEKDKRNELKRSLDKMEQDMTADMQTMKEEADNEVRSMRQLIRELRQDVKVVKDQREGLRELLVEVEERQANVKTKQDKVMKTLNARNLRLEQKQKDRDECIVVLEGGVKEKTKDIVGLGKGIVVLEKQIGSLKKRIEAATTERKDCVKKLDDCIEGQQRTIVTLETNIDGQGRQIVALGQKHRVLERLGAEHTQRHGELLDKLDAAEQQHEVGHAILFVLSLLLFLSHIL
jgi:chromosome segregation ATPase